MSASAEVLVTVRLDADTYRAWRAEADRRNADVGQLLAAAAAHSITPVPGLRTPQPAPRRGKLTDAQVAEILAEPTTSSTVLGDRYGVTGQTIRNIRKAGR